ncbi:MAG: hypothetical protein M1288_02605 [Actinobacteria bacterium]|nr:hypothetical protein [Actinomycetota bacterium]
MNKLNRLASRKIFAAFVLVIAAWAMALPASGSLQGINSGLASYSNPPVIGFGNAPIYAPSQPVVPNSVIVAMAATPDGKGYWLVGATGQVFDYGDAPDLGSLSDPSQKAPIIAMAATPDGKGYWLVGSDGSVYPFGDAQSYGSTANLNLNGPIVGIASTPDGKGYWLVGADGGIFTFGDAAFYGSMGGKYLAGAIVGMASTPDGKGYWLVGADGGIFTFGDAAFYGSMGGKPINASVVGMAATADGKGYWLVGADGGIFTFGDAPFYGSLGGKLPNIPISAITGSQSGPGYYLLSPDSFNYQITPTANEGVTRWSQQIILTAESQVAPASSPGSFCNPYGPCEEWCALFASWIWSHSGVPTPSYGFTGALYDWVAHNQQILPPSQLPAEGDFVFYGTGPGSASTSVHMGIVAQTWPDGSLVTIEGDSGPGPGGYLGVTLNGPFLISHSLEQNGSPIYGFGQPNN